MSVWGLTLTYPESWTPEADEDDAYYLTSPDGGLIQILYTPEENSYWDKNTPDDEIEPIVQAIKSGLLAPGELKDKSIDDMTISTFNEGKKATGVFTYSLDNVIFKGPIQFIFSGSSSYIIVASIPSDVTSEQYEQLNQFIENIKVKPYSAS